MAPGRDRSAGEDRERAAAPAQPQPAPAAKRPRKAKAKGARRAQARRAPTTEAPPPSELRFAVEEGSKPPKSKLPRGRGRPSQLEKESVETAQRAAIAAVTAANGIANLAFGDVGRMTEPERVTITDPLQRMFERADPETLEVISVYADPFQAIMGVVAWITRVARTIAERRKGEEGPPGGPPGAPPAEPEEPPPGDGRKDLIAEDLAPEAADLGPTPLHIVRVPIESLRRPVPGLADREELP